MSISGASCSREVFPPAVIDSVVSQMHNFEAPSSGELPEALQLTADMETANLKESVLVQLDETLNECDVVRGSEVLKNTLVLVVRRPG